MEHPSMTAPLSQPYPERIRELEREVECGVTEIVALRNDLDDALAKLEITRQQYMDADHMLRLRDTECRRLRSEASELMAENADANLLIASLRQEVDWLKANTQRQAEVIREQGAEIERLKAPRVPNAEERERIVREFAKMCNDTGQHDLPPTRGEEQERT